MSDVQLEELVAGQPADVRAEIVRSTTTPGRWHFR